MSGTAWMTANALSIACFAACAAYLTAPSVGRAGLTVLLGLMAAVTYGTGLLSLPIAALIVLCLRPPKPPVALSLGALAVTGGYAWVFRTPDHHPAPITDVTLLFRSVSGLLGRMWTENPDTAKLIGVVAIVSTLFLVTMLLRDERQDTTVLFFWASVLFHGLGNAVLIALTRAGSGNDIGVGLTRYATIRSLFWIGWLMIVILALLRTRMPRWSIGVLQVLIASGLVLSYINSYNWTPYLKKQSTKEVASIALRLGHTDERRVSTHIFSAEYYGMINIVPLLRNIGHYPFHSSFRYDCGLLGNQLSLDAIIADKPGRPVGGFFDGLRMLKPDLAEATGWAHSKGEAIECVVVVDENRRVVGAAVPGFPRPDVSKALKITDESTGWIGYVQVSNAESKFTALARTVGDNRFYSLGRRKMHSLEAAE